MRYIYSLPEETSKRSFENSSADIRWATLLHGITTVLNYMVCMTLSILLMTTFMEINTTSRLQDILFTPDS